MRTYKNLVYETIQNMAIGTRFTASELTDMIAKDRIVAPNCNTVVAHLRGCPFVQVVDAKPNGKPSVYERVINGRWDGETPDKVSFWYLMVFIDNDTVPLYETIYDANDKKERARVHTRKKHIRWRYKDNHITWIENHIVDRSKI